MQQLLVRTRGPSASNDCCGKLQVSITLSATLVRPRRWLSCALGGEELCSPTASTTPTVSRASKRSARQSDVARLTKLVSAQCRRALTVAECHGAPWARATRATHGSIGRRTRRRPNNGTLKALARLYRAGLSSTRRAQVRSRLARREVDLYTARCWETYSWRSRLDADQQRSRRRPLGGHF